MSLPRERSAVFSTYLAQDTIAAIASAVGGAVALVRLSGPSAFAIAEKVGAQILASTDARKLVRVRLQTPDGVSLDDALAVKFVAPRSFTGEDVVEFQIHGGSYLAARLIETLLQVGARQALPGEFSFRAIRNGKFSLSQAQALTDLIQANNDNAIELALEKMSGTQNRLLREIADGLRTLATLGEVGIDFSDQDVEEVSLPALKKRVLLLMNSLEALRSSYDRGARIQDGIRVAFIGLPNSGKSSFFNALLGEDRSIVSEVAGTTRDVVREKINLRGEKGGVTLRLEDTAGLRKTEDIVEKLGIERSRKTAREAELVFAIFDPTQNPEAALAQWSEIAKDPSACIGIISKSDLLTPEQQQAYIARLSSSGIENFVALSSVTGKGLPAAVEAVIQASEKLTMRSRGEVVLTRLDHLRAVEQTLGHLTRSLTLSENDLFASDIRQAMVAMGPLIGDTLPDDILAKIFSDFCIGK